MKILSIGNSFSQDAQRYLHRIARKDGVALDTVNLCIGGCPLSLHHAHMKSGAVSHYLEVNGESSDFPVSLKDALCNSPWDAVTLQQVSHEAPYFETYEPYLSELAAYIRAHAPSAKILLQQTWAYEEGSKRLTAELGYANYKDMLADVRASYERAAEIIHADGIIRSGELFDRMLCAGIPRVHRDTFHATLGLGRYAIGLLWYATLTGKDVSEDRFSDLDEPATEEELCIARRCVAELVRDYR